MYRYISTSKYHVSVPLLIILVILHCAVYLDYQGTAVFIVVHTAAADYQMNGSSSHSSIALAVAITTIGILQQNIRPNLSP